LGAALLGGLLQRLRGDDAELPFGVGLQEAGVGLVEDDPHGAVVGGFGAVVAAQVGAGGGGGALLCQLPQLLEVVRDDPGGQLLAVAEGHALADGELIGPAAVGDLPGLGQVGFQLAAVGVLAEQGVQDLPAEERERVGLGVVQAGGVPAVGDPQVGGVGAVGGGATAAGASGEQEGGRRGGGDQARSGAGCHWWVVLSLSVGVGGMRSAGTASSSARVCGLFGSVNSSSVGACSSARPRCRTSTSWATARTTPRSCETSR